MQFSQVIFAFGIFATALAQEKPSSTVSTTVTKATTTTHSGTKATHAATTTTATHSTTSTETSSKNAGPTAGVMNMAPILGLAAAAFAM
ncbi:hypothetical protein HIM_02976 [Hirsutella minnesotensis 3608]|nr:hypothetical protein HIM_02976 [Hirsutella minnesotensis 3608]